jgi:DNA-binding MarR family transcriptional regulator
LKKVDFKKISTHETPERSPGFLLWQISTTWRSSIESILKPMGLTHPQFVILATLGWLTRKGEKVTQIAIGTMAGLDPNTTSQIIRGLEQKQLIKREQSSDGRAKNPCLTARGKQILMQALPAVERMDERFFHPLTSKEIDAIIHIFQKLSSSST